MEPTNGKNRNVWFVCSAYPELSIIIDTPRYVLDATQMPHFINGKTIFFNRGIFSTTDSHVIERIRESSLYQEGIITESLVPPDGIIQKERKLVTGVIDSRASSVQKSNFPVPPQDVQLALGAVQVPRKRGRPPKTSSLNE